MIATERAYQNRKARIHARTQPWIDLAKLSDVRKDVLWLMAELEETRAALFARIAQDEARRAS